jgi:hypothetical protein
MAKYRIIKNSEGYYWEKQIFLWSWYRSLWPHETIDEATKSAVKDARANDHRGEVVVELGRLP